MATTPTTGPADWRELAGQLTAEQIRDLEFFEASVEAQSAAGFPEVEPGAARRIAEGFIEENEAQVRLAYIPAPDDADAPPQPWKEWGGDVWVRGFTTLRRRFTFPAEAGVRASTVTVEAAGEQFSDGTCERRVYAAGDGLEGMTPQQARAVAAALVEAADRIDAANGVPTPTDVLGALRALAVEVEAEVESASGDLGVHHMRRMELSGVRRAVRVAETAAMRRAVQ